MSWPLAYTPFPFSIQGGCHRPLEVEVSRREGVSARGLSGSSLTSFFKSAN